MAFDNARNNRTLQISADGNTIAFARLSFDPPGFTQNFTRSSTPFPEPPAGSCASSSACCIFKDDIDALVAGVRARAGRRRPCPIPTVPLRSSTPWPAHRT